MACPCGETGIRTALTPEGKIRMCAGCGRQIDAVMVPPQAEQEAGEPSPVPVVKPTRQPATDRRVTARNVIADARREVAALRRSISAHEKALKKERSQLDALTRLLDAADDKPCAVVRLNRTTA